MSKAKSTASGSYQVLKNLIPYLNEYKWWYLIGFLFLFIHNYGFVGLSENLKYAMAEITSSNQRGVVITHLLNAVGYLMLTCTFMYFMRYLIIGNSRKIEYAIRKKLFDKLMHLPIQFYQKEQTGDLVSRLTNDLNDVRTLLGPGIMYIPNSLSRIGFFIPLMLAISWKLLIIIFAQMLILIIIILIVMPKLRPFYTRIQEARAHINNHAWQVIFGINTVKLNTMEETKSKEFLKLNKDYYKRNLNLAIIEGFTWPFFFFFFSLSQVVILYVGGEQIINGEIKTEELFQFSVMIGVITFPIFSLGWVISILQQGTSAWGRINKILLQPQEPNYTTELPSSPLEIEFKNVSFTTSEETSTSENDNRGTNGRNPKKTNYLLKNISFKIKPGKLIGIAGRTGSGKTLLLELLTGITKPTSGKILIGGQDITTLNKASLYKRMSFTPQETFLFSTTIKNNIGFQDDLNPIFEKVVSSAKISDVEKDIRLFPNQFEEVLGERGINLSGGQKQRTAISRSIYKEADILVMDDSLSSVDAQTEENIISNLRQLKSLKTIIVASHKVSFLKFADEILFLKDGEIVEKGSHQALMKKTYYSRIAQLQKLEKTFESLNTFTSKKLPNKLSNKL